VVARLFSPRVNEPTDLARVVLPDDTTTPADAFTARKIVGELGHGGGPSSQIEDPLYNAWVWWLAGGAGGCE